MVENSLFLAPAAYQDPQKAQHVRTKSRPGTVDYLVCVSKEAQLRPRGERGFAYKRGYIMPMPATFLVGQLEPKVKVFQPKRPETKNMRKRLFDLRVVYYLYNMSISRARAGQRPGTGQGHDGFVYEHHLCDVFDKFEFDAKACTHTLKRLREKGIV